MIMPSTLDRATSLLWECRALLEEKLDDAELNDTSDMDLLRDVRAFTDGQIGFAVKLRPTGAAHKDRLVAAALHVRESEQ
jgi:hypothetical protein